MADPNPIDDDERVLEELNSPADYHWRCPCMDMPCHAATFARIQDLIAHMRAEHGLTITPFRPPVVGSE